MRIQQVTDDIAESLNIKPPRGALVAGVDDKGPAKPAGIEPGDVVVNFDGHDIKEMHDLPRIVADTPVGKEVDVVVIRKGKEETHKVTIGRLKDNEKVAEAEAKKDTAPEQKSVVQKTLGLELSSLSDDLRKKFKIRDNVKGVVVTGVDPSVAAAAPDKRLAPGDVIVEVQYQSVGNPADLQNAARSAQGPRQEGRGAPGLQCGRGDAVRGVEPAVGGNQKSEIGSRRPSEFRFPISDFRLRSIQHVADHAVGELRLEPGGFRRHDFAGVGDRHEIAHLRRVERERDRHGA